MRDQQPIIELIQFSVDHRLVNITEMVFAGEQIHLLGANGAGKSTLLCAMSGFSPYTGQLRIHGKAQDQYDTQELSQLRSYLPQQVSILPALKVFQYIALFQSKGSYQTLLFDSLCQDFQLEKLLLKTITQLSGGEWQRVQIVSTFLQVWCHDNLYGKFILFDEPTNNLDIIQQANFDKWVKYFCDCQGTIIITSHNLTYSYQCANRIWMMKKGNIIFSGQPEIVMNDFNVSEIFEGKISLTQNKSWRVIY